MTATSTLIPDQNSSNRKDTLTRLLDLLAGWSDFVSKDEENGIGDTALSADEIGKLYQEAGQLIEGWDELSSVAREQQIRSFVANRIVPRLLGHETDL